MKLVSLVFTTPFLAALLLLLALACCFPMITEGYSSGVPQLNRRALAGLWKLTPSVLSIKEFTVHPRKPQKKEEEVLLMLKEDGSFTRYELEMEDDNEDEEDSTTITSSSKKKKDVDQSWKQFLRSDPSDTNNNNKPIQTVFKGTWDYRDGELILAADRDEQKAKSDNYGGTSVSSGTTGNTNDPDNPQLHSHSQQHKANTAQQNLFWKKGKDTILIGAVVATTQYQPPPQQPPLDNKPQQSQSPKEQKLSVPMGSVQVGKFFYPKNHPSFFDQPIFQPKRFGTFQLKQVLGNAIKEEQVNPQLVEKFRNQDFHNKRFFLTSSPIEPRRPKGNVRWSIKYNKYVEDPPSKEAAKAADDASKRLVSAIRVMEVMIHANNTFSSIGGLGETTVLRGRFNVIGDQRDQVWMHTSRFGFGRSVSGSTYSEGNALNEEKKSYWGKISYEGGEDDEDEEEVVSENKDGGDDSTEPTDDEEEKPKRRLEVKGTVLVGWGLEPQPIANFVMREADDDDSDSNEEDDDDEEEEEDIVVVDNDDDNEGNIWTSGDAFQ